jgi:PAS domain S-box-containing protein
MSISQKLTLWIILAVALFGILSAVSYYHYETSVELQQMQGLGATIGPIIEQSLDHYMMTKDLKPLERSLENFIQIKPITSISLVNRAGVIKASTAKNSVGTTVDQSDPRCQRCHEEGMRSIVLKKESILRWVQPVSNKPPCYGCHDPSVNHNGVIVIDFSTLESEHNVRMHILRGGLIFLFALLSVSLLLMFLFRSLVITRLAKVIERIGSFKKGDYVARAPVEGNDEITNLEEGFNEMAESINERDKRQALLIAQISESQKQWEETFNSITDLISIQDKDYRIIRANRAFLDYFHLSPEDIRDKHCYEVLHGERPSAACPDVASLTSCQPSFAEIIDSRTSRILEISTFPLCDADGNATGTIHIARDITDERERDMSLTVSERLATLGQMASGLAHELNNPLASVSACAEGLLRRIGKGQSDPALFEEYLKIIEEEASRCRDITNNMLSFVRKGTYDKKELDLHEMLDNALTIIGLQGRLKDVKVVRTSDDSLPRIHGSEGELRQVFLTVITNAIDAMGERGTLTVATKAENKRVSVAVTDTGQGIPPEHLDKIFQTFFTTKGDKGGVGLGLSIAKKIIESHGGTIEVASAVGVGTTFTITLPA